MRAQIRGTSDVVTIRWIPKYTLLERAGHWVHTGTFIPLVLTGLVLYTPLLAPLAQGESGTLVRLVHRMAAVGFIVLPLVYFLLEPRRLLLSLRELMLDKDSLGWAKGAVGYYLLGRHADMPPQGRFNAGEKLNGVVVVLSWGVFVVTGLAMWFGKGYIPYAVLQWAVVVHDLAMIAVVCMFLVHLYLVFAHPLMWAALVSMRFGVTSASYAAEHHAKWFYGPKRAMELYEIQKKAKARPQPSSPGISGNDGEPRPVGQQSPPEPVRR